MGERLLLHHALRRQHPAGERIEFWEADVIEVNDDGKITHWEGYNNPMGVDRLFQVTFGKSLQDIGSPENMPSMGIAPQKPTGQSKNKK